MKKIIRLLLYGWLLNYHIKKKDKFDNKYQTVLRFHYDMAQYYYEKIYGNPSDGD